MVMAEREMVITPDQQSQLNEPVEQAFHEFVEALRRLHPVTTTDQVEVTLTSPGGEQRTAIPANVFETLLFVVREMARGNAITLMPVETKLTTQQAADLLGVSRPFVVKLLENGEMEYEKVGRHRRVLLRDVLAHKERQRRRADTALTEMAREAQDLGIY